MNLKIKEENSGSCYSHVYRKLVQLSGCSLALVKGVLLTRKCTNVNL